MVLALAAAVAVSGFSFYRANAASYIDENKQCSITVQIPTACLYEEGNHTGISDGIIMYDGDVTVNFYKIAEVELNGSYGKALADVDLSVLNNKEVYAKQWEDLTNNAYKAVKNTKPTYTMTINPSKETKKSIDVDRGLYLYVCEDVSSERFDFTFKKSMISVPSSYLIQGATKLDENGNIIEASNSDEWLYNVDVAIKSVAEQRYGNLQINKTLKTFNKSLGSAAFVFDVTAKLDGNTVFSNVYTMNFTDATTQSIKVEGIPATASVTVKEIYTGASYTLQSDDDLSKETVVYADKDASVDFSNDYDERLELGGISVENQFTMEDGKIYWIDESGNKIEQKTVEGGN